MRKFMKTAMAGTLSLAMVLGVTGVAALEASAAKVKVKKVAVTSPSGKVVYVAKGKKVKLSTTVKVSPNKSANKKVSYKSANRKIATVNSKGIVKGVKPGKTKITVVSKKSKKKKASIRVVVKKAAIKKVTLNVKSANLSIGESKQLKAKAVPTKNTSTKIAWSSSNKKVAVVSSKGKVTGKATGTATITAKAADGSGKKAKCKVTVKNNINLIAMDVQNAQTITFSLDRAMALNASQVQISNKWNIDGAYNRQLKIDTMTTADNKNYTVVVNSDNRISENSYVKVTIPVLPGSVKSMEKKYSEALCAYTEDQISTWTVNEYDSKNFYFDSDDGYSTYSITGLPAGLTSEVKGNALVVKGTPAAAGVSVATMTAKDELGNTLTKTITFLVGSATQIVGAATPVYTLATTADSNNVFKSPTVTGGSGNYRYTIVGDTGAAAKFEDPEDDGSSYDGDIVAKVVAAGNYTVTLHVVDRENAALACDFQVVIHVAQGVSIVGMVKDAVGNAIPGAEIEYTNKNRADRYSTYASAMTDKDGAYSATVSAGTYDIAASYNDNSSYSDNAKAVNYLYKQDLTVSKSGFDIMLPLYKVALATTNQNTSLSSVTWYANHEKLGYGANLYLKAGVYNLESGTTGSSSETTRTGDYTWFNGGAITYTTTYTEKKFTASVNVANAPVQAIANEAVVGQKQSSSYTNKYSAAKDTTYVAKLDTTYYLDETSASGEYYNDCYGAYKFVPSEDGTYSIDSSSYVCFYDENGTNLGNEKVTLTTGKTYIVGANDEDSDASFTIKKDAVEVPAE